jgi:glucose/mannose-6-phosphate isomerase
MTLDDPAVYERGDARRARAVLAEFPAQCRTALALAPEPELARGRPRLVVLAGMGGSAASGDLLAACAEDRVDVPILVHRGYGLPAVAGKHALVIASSYSGDTAEVMSAAEVAVARGVMTVALTAGGKLAAFAAARGLPRVALPAGLMPRMALGYLLLPAIGLLRRVELEVATEHEVTEAVRVVEELGTELLPDRPTAGNEAKRLALAIGARLPVIYGGPATRAVAYRWKTDIEENAKAFALANALPEMNHNEIEAWRTPSARNMSVILLRDDAEPDDIAHRFAVLEDMIAPAAGGVTATWTRGKGRLARLLALSHLGQWTSFYLAMLRGVDPWSVPLLEELKRRTSGPHA